MLTQPHGQAFEGKDDFNRKDARAAEMNLEGVHLPAGLEGDLPTITRWTAVAGYVDARGVVVGFLLEAEDGTRAPLDLTEPVGDIRVLTAMQLKAAEAAGHVRAG